MTADFEKILDEDVEDVLDAGKNSEICTNFVPGDRPNSLFRIERRQGNPNCECLTCDGYACNCEGYEPAK